MEMVDAAHFRSAMARLASAVTLVTTDGSAGARGLAATAVTSITDDPPNLLVCVNKSGRSDAIINRLPLPSWIKTPIKKGVDYASQYVPDVRTCRAGGQ